MVFFSKTKICPIVESQAVILFIKAFSGSPAGIRGFTELMDY